MAIEILFIIGLDCVALKNYLSLQKEDILSIGDNVNDISMFKTCGYSVAMGNALPNVKSIADYVTLDNEHDGVAYFIQQKLLR